MVKKGQYFESAGVLLRGTQQAVLLRNVRTSGVQNEKHPQCKWPSIKLTGVLVRNSGLLAHPLPCAGSSWYRTETVL
jgi:hypothetical protein